MSDQNRSHYRTSFRNKANKAKGSWRARDQRGQGLIEYLIIVALMGVATIAIVRVMGETVASRFAIATHALQGEKKSIKPNIDSSHYKKKDLGNFFDGVEDKSGGK